MALSAILFNSDSVNSLGFSSDSFKTEEPSKIKEMLQAEKEKAEKSEQIESEKAAKEEKKASEEEKKAKKDAKASEEAEKEERKRKFIERRKAEEDSAVEEKKQARLFATSENKTDTSSSETDSAEEGNSTDDKNKDSVTLSKIAGRLSSLSSLTTRFESTNNRLSMLDKDWATDEDFAYQQLQIIKDTIQQQSPAAIFSQANLNPGRVVSLFQ